jgi:bifunctional DNA-binding transcriptional regulator/antitoxin component of YhaV-PrlF toxin-antitoxin module
VHLLGIIDLGGIDMVVTSISSKGQVTLPVQLRRQAGLELKDRILIEVQDGQLIIRKAGDIMGLKGFLGKGAGSKAEQKKMQQFVSRHQTDHQHE